jgi:hypothetical protein
VKNFQPFTTLMHPDDMTYQLARQEQINDLLKNYTAVELRKQLDYMQLKSEVIRDDHNLAPKLLAKALQSMPLRQKSAPSILDSTSGTTGNVLLRQDLEPILTAIFIKEFPAFDAMTKKPSNGLVHVENQITTPANGMSLGGTAISETGTVTYDSAAYNRVSFPIAVFAVGRGVSFKEIAAVRAGGSPYDVHNVEMGMGMIQLAQDVQYFLMQGNASNSGGAGLSTEEGAYNTLGFDGFRGVIGSQGTFSGNNAIQIDIGSLNIYESIQNAAAKARNNGGHPDTLFCSLNFKQALDTEQQGNKRYNDSAAEISPGVNVNTVVYADGVVRIIAIPGTTMGTYTRASDSATVEDAYLLDFSTVYMPWLYSEGWTVLQIPSGVDGVLSERWIVFGMYGLTLIAPAFYAKIRRVAS